MPGAPEKTSLVRSGMPCLEGNDPAHLRKMRLRKARKRFQGTSYEFLKTPQAGNKHLKKQGCSRTMTYGVPKSGVWPEIYDSGSFFHEKA
jgi:hypothetical protein